MPIFLSCFSAGSAGSSPTSSQNATLPSSSAWPLSASGYSSSFSSIASAPSIAGTNFHSLLCPQERGPRQCFPTYCSSATRGTSVLYRAVLGRQLSWQLLGGMPGIMRRKRVFTHLVPCAGCTGIKIFLRLLPL